MRHRVLQTLFPELISLHQFLLRTFSQAEGICTSGRRDARIYSIETFIVSIFAFGRHPQLPQIVDRHVGCHPRWCTATTGFSLNWAWHDPIRYHLSCVGVSVQVLVPFFGLIPLFINCIPPPAPRLTPRMSWRKAMAQYARVHTALLFSLTIPINSIAQDWGMEYDRCTVLRTTSPTHSSTLLLPKISV